MSNDGAELHRYPMRLPLGRWHRASNWLLYAFLALEVLRFGWGLIEGEFYVQPLVFVAFVAAALVFVRHTQRNGAGALVLSPDGLVCGRQSASWDEIERIAMKRSLGKWGKRYDVFVLTEPKPISKALVPSGQYDSIQLGYWFPDWYNSPIRDDIARWAPRLLTGTNYGGLRPRPEGPERR